MQNFWVYVQCSIYILQLEKLAAFKVVQYVKLENSVVEAWLQA